MPETVISNSTCLIGLERIGRLDILQKLYGEIIISETVQNEVGLINTPWIKVEKVRNSEALRFLTLEIDRGEAETILLGTELKASLVIIDEKKARKIAKRLGLKITGLVGALLRAKKAGIIQKVSEIIDSLEKVNFRLSEEIKERVKKLSGEI